MAVQSLVEHHQQSLEVLRKYSEQIHVLCDHSGGKRALILLNCSPILTPLCSGEAMAASPVPAGTAPVAAPQPAIQAPAPAFPALPPSMAPLALPSAMPTPLSLQGPLPVETGPLALPAPVQQPSSAPPDESASQPSSMAGSRSPIRMQKLPPIQGHTPSMAEAEELE